MKPSKELSTMDVYASNSQYVSGPTSDQQKSGTIPLDTLPADWWNWLWKQITSRINAATSDVNSIYDEVYSILSAASITPSSTQSDQLLIAIRAIARTIGTGTSAGAVKSSADSGKVAIDADGYMSPNGMGIPSSLNTTARTIVGAVNEVLASLNDYKTTNDAAVSGLDASKAPISHATDSSMYGKGTEGIYGHVKLSDSVSSPSDANSGIAATPKAVKTVQDALDTYKEFNDITVESKAPTSHASSSTTYGSGNGSNYGHVKLSDSVSSPSDANSGIAATPKAVKTVQDNVNALSAALTLPPGIVLPFAGGIVPAGWLLCNGAAYSRTDYANLFAVIGTIYGEPGDTTFNVPDLRRRFPEMNTTSPTSVDVGTKIAPGIPNVLGEFNMPHPMNICTGARGLSKADAYGFSYNLSYYSGSNAGGKIHLNLASGERKKDGTYRNDVYGKSDTVQPAALTMLYIIKT